MRKMEETANFFICSKINQSIPGGSPVTEGGSPTLFKPQFLKSLSTLVHVFKTFCPLKIPLLSFSHF